MSGYNIISRLPAYYRSSPTLFKIAELIQKSSVRFSGLFISKGGENYLLIKDGTLHVPEDWQAYSLLRATTRLFISSGAVLRSEPGLFMVRQAYGNPNVESVNQTFTGSQRQKVFFFTRSLSQEQIKSQLNEKLYEVVNPPTYKSSYDAIEQLHTKENLPMTVEVGMELLNQYFHSVDNGQTNRIDTLLISKYEGEAEEKLIGPKFSIPLEKYYDLQWKSQPYPCKISNEQKGHLTFEVFTSKTKL